MKYYHYILIFILCISCQLQSKSSELKSSDENLSLRNGVLYYLENPFSGKLIDKNENSILLLDIGYVNGRKHGYERKRYQNGSLAEERFYTSGKKSGIHKAWYKNNQQKFEYHFNTIGEYNGSVREWYNSGQLYTDFNFENGKETGSQQMWRADGKIRANFVVKNGERFGLIGLKKCNSVNSTKKI